MAAQSPVGMTSNNRRSRSKKRASQADVRARLWAAIGRLGRNLNEQSHGELVAGLVYLRGLCCTAELIERVKSLAPRDGSGRSPYLPANVRWEHFVESSSATLPMRLEEAMRLIEEANPELFGVFPRGYAKRGVSRAALVELIGVLGSFPFDTGGSINELVRVARDFCGIRSGATAPRDVVHALDAQLAESRRVSNRTRESLQNTRRHSRPANTRLRY